MKLLALVFIVFGMACMLEAGLAIRVGNVTQAVLLFIVGAVFGLGAGALWERR